MHYDVDAACSPPADRDTPLLRYMDLAKFVSMLHSSTLFFSRADNLGDDFEGSYSPLNRTLRPSWYEGISDEQLEKLSYVYRLWRRFVFVSCWNESTEESAALWGIYAPAGAGVAVRSSFGRLVDSLLQGPEDEGDPVSSRVMVGTVRYIDYAREAIEEGNPLRPFLHKRRAYEFESEVRAVIQAPPIDPTRPEGDQLHLEASTPPGIAVGVDLNELIEEVYVSPFGAGWFYDVVASVAARYELDARVARSTLYGDPVF